MGACNFVTHGFGTDIKQAFARAVDAAQYEHGHDSYNGTISTTSFRKELTSEMPRYGTKAFRKALDKFFESAPKWECFAVEITGKALKEYRKRHGLERKRGKAYLFFGVASC